MTEPIAEYSSAVPSRLSKSALISFICGVLGCLPIFLTGILALILGFVGLGATAKPGVRGRWMAILGIILGLLNLGFSGVFVYGIYKVAPGVVSALAAPGHGARDFIRAVDSGDDAAAKDLSVMSDADFEAAKVLIKAQGGFTDSTFNNVNITNNNAHVSGIGDFKTGTRQISVDVVEVDGKWKVKSLSITP